MLQRLETPCYHEALTQVATAQDCENLIYDHPDAFCFIALILNYTAYADRPLVSNPSRESLKRPSADESHVEVVALLHEVLQVPAFS